MSTPPLAYRPHPKSNSLNAARAPRKGGLNGGGQANASGSEPGGPALSKSHPLCSRALGAPLPHARPEGAARLAPRLPALLQQPAEEGRREAASEVRAENRQLAGCPGLSRSRGLGDLAQAGLLGDRGGWEAGHAESGAGRERGPTSTHSCAPTVTPPWASPLWSARWSAHSFSRPPCPALAAPALGTCCPLAPLPSPLVRGQGMTWDPDGQQEALMTAAALRPSAHVLSRAEKVGIPLRHHTLMVREPSHGAGGSGKRGATRLRAAGAPHSRRRTLQMRGPSHRQEKHPTRGKSAPQVVRPAALQDH